MEIDLVEFNLQFKSHHSSRLLVPEIFRWRSSLQDIEQFWKKNNLIDRILTN